MNTKFLATLAIFAVITVAQAQQPTLTPSKPTASPTPTQIDPGIINELKGEWKNELGSTLKIVSIDAITGLITGDYKSPSGTPGTAFPLTGWVNTAPPNSDAPHHVVVVSFSVRWGAIGSVTTWNGYYHSAAGKATIVGQWLLSRPNSQFIWDHILIGQDRFTK